MNKLSNKMYIKKMIGKGGIISFKIVGSEKCYNYPAFMDLHNSLIETVKTKFPCDGIPHIRLSENLLKVHNGIIGRAKKKEYDTIKSELKDTLTIYDIFSTNHMEDIVITNKDKSKRYLIVPELIDSDYISDSSSFKIPMFKITDKKKTLVKRLATLELISDIIKAISIEVSNSYNSVIL